MAIYFNGGQGTTSNKYVNKGALGFSTSLSASWWVRFVQIDTSLYANMVNQVDQCGVSVWNNAGTIRWNYGTNTTDDTATTGPSMDTWYHVVWVRNGDFQTIYVDGTQVISAERTQAADVWALGRWSSGDTQGESSNFYMAAIKIWDDVQLTTAEIASEAKSWRPVRRDGLAVWMPGLYSTVQDIPGSVWTEAGTSGTISLVNTVNPPIWWGGSPQIVGGAAGPGSEYVGYGTPRDHVGVWPFNSVWRPARM